MSNWHRENSSGYDGYRCLDCGTWIYMGGLLVCKCWRMEKTMTKEQYEEDLKHRQNLHRAKIRDNKEANWKPCKHDECPTCIGTGIKEDGSPCIHNIHCDCPKCTAKF